MSGTDANDVLQATGPDGLREIFDQSVATQEQIAIAVTETTGRAPVAFPLVSFGNIRLDTSQRNYLIKGTLPRTGLAVIWGAPKCYKSFIATDMALHVALGRRYRGRRVQQAPVVYIALEGREGQAARAEAFKQYHGIDEAAFYLIRRRSIWCARLRNLLLASKRGFAT